MRDSEQRRRAERARETHARVRVWQLTFGTCNHGWAPARRRCAVSSLYWKTVPFRGRSVSTLKWTRLSSFLSDVHAKAIASLLLFLLVRSVLENSTILMFPDRGTTLLYLRYSCIRGLAEQVRLAMAARVDGMMMMPIPLT